MTKGEAKEIASEITNEQLYMMFLNAKNNIIDWSAPSKQNKSLSKGVAWNIFAKDFTVKDNRSFIWKLKAITEFGEHLQGNLKPVKRIRPKIKVNHQEPDFSNF